MGMPLVNTAVWIYENMPKLSYWLGLSQLVADKVAAREDLLRDLYHVQLENNVQKLKDLELNDAMFKEVVYALRENGFLTGEPIHVIVVRLLAELKQLRDRVRAV